MKRVGTDVDIVKAIGRLSLKSELFLFCSLSMRCQSNLPFHVVLKGVNHEKCMIIYGRLSEFVSITIKTPTEYKTESYLTSISMVHTKMHIILFLEEKTMHIFDLCLGDTIYIFAENFKCMRKHIKHD